MNSREKMAPTNGIDLILFKQLNNYECWLDLIQHLSQRFSSLKIQIFNENELVFQGDYKEVL